MTRMLLSLGLALFIGLNMASAQDVAKKECPKKPAAEKKEQAKKPPLTEAEKAERAKKQGAAAATAFKAKDKNGDGKLTADELKGKSTKPEAAERVVAAILDLDMPGLKRIQDLTLVRRKRPDIYLIVLSGSEDRDDILAALAAGAHGYIVKNVSTTSLVEQIKTILDGTIYVPACLARLPEDPATAPQSGDAAPMPPAITGLTERQNEVLRLIAQGLSNKRIAHALAISEGTVKMHVTSILRVTGASNRAQAAALGLRTAGETTT